MLDVIEQLQRYGDAVTETVEPVRSSDVGLITIDALHQPDRPIWQPLLAAAAAIALVAGGFWFIVDRSNATPPAGNPPSSRSPESGSATPTIPTSTGPQSATGPHASVELLDAGPLAPRDGAALAWTGTELVVWGGAIEPANRGLTGPARAFGDGAAYNPTTRAWRPMAPGPLPVDRNAPIAVATTDGVMIARGTSVARWKAATDTWEPLNDAPAPVADLTFVGPDLVVSISANATVDPATGQWRALPAPPLNLDRPVAAWNGTELIVVGQRNFSNPCALALNPDTRTWRELPDPPNLNPVVLSADRSGDRAVFVDYQMNSAADGAGSWESLPAIPACASEYTPEFDVVPPADIVSTARAVVVRAGNLWIPVPKGTLDFWGGHTVVAASGTGRAGPSLFVFGLTSAGANRLAWVDPAQIAAEARTLQVGEMTLQLPDGMTLVHSDYVTRPNEQTVLVTLSTPTGNCDVTSTHDGGVGGDTHPWSAYAGGLTWTGRATSSDAVKVVCGSDAQTAKTIVDATSVPVAPPGG